MTLNATDAIEIVKDAIAINDEDFINIIPTTFNIHNLSLDDSYLLLNTFLEIAAQNEQPLAFNKLLSLWELRYDNFTPPIQLSIFQYYIFTDEVLKYFIENNPVWAFSEMISILIQYDQGPEASVALERIFNLYDPINRYSNVDEILSLLADKSNKNNNKVVADYIWTFRKQTAPYAEKPKWIADYRESENIVVNKVNNESESKRAECNLAESVESKCNIDIKEVKVNESEQKRAETTNNLPYADYNYPVTEPDIKTIFETNTLADFPDFLDSQAEKLGLASQTNEVSGANKIDFKAALLSVLGNNKTLSNSTLNDLPSEIKSSFSDMFTAAYKSTLQSDTELFRWYGPSHPMIFDNLARIDNRSPFCSLYGGCRMLTCLHGSLTDEYGDELNYPMNIEKDWFTGICDQCGLRIKHKHYAVRLPDIAGGWSGVFHNFECMRDWISDNIDDNENEPLEFRLSLVDIFEKEILRYGIQDRLYKANETSETSETSETTEDEYSADEFQLYTGLPITEQSFIRDGSFDP